MAIAIRPLTEDIRASIIILSYEQGNWTSKGWSGLFRVKWCVAELELSSSSGPSLMITVHEGLYLQKEEVLPCARTEPEACATSQQSVSLSLIYKWIKMSALLQMQWYCRKCYFRENKRQPKQTVWIYSMWTPCSQVSSHQYSCLMTLPTDLLEKSWRGTIIQAALIERNEGKEVSFVKYLGRNP